MGTIFVLRYVFYRIILNAFPRDTVFSDGIYYDLTNLKILILTTLITI